MLDQKTIDAMAAAGVGFIVNIRTVMGGHNVLLEPQDVSNYIADPVRFAAAHLGATKSEYEEWLASEGHLRCSGLTVEGRPCRNYLSGGSQTSIQDWLNKAGGYCVVHGGEGSIEAREGGS